MVERNPAWAWTASLLATATAAGDWPTFVDETDLRLVADAAVGSADVEEKDYAWGDVDRDGDVDLVIVRKQPFSTPGGRRNVLLLNEGGVLTDRTAEFIAGFLDETNDRDAVLVDVNNDAWLDLVTAAMCHGCTPGTVSESRLYLNLGDDGSNNWLGFGAPSVLLDGARNLSAVAAGDVTGDGYADLYFVSGLDPFFEDQLLVNQGTADPGIFAPDNDRLSAQMLQSGIGTSVVIADIDGDTDNDIAKTENGPVEIFRNSGVNGPGQFDLLDPTYTGAAYHVNAGHLDDDGMLDLVIVDDGLDRYILNDGDMLDGDSDPPSVFPATTQGFGGGSVIVDLDGDGYNDVLIASMSIDAPGCGRKTSIARNNADPPAVTFTNDVSNLPDAVLLGVFDMAVFDIDGDEDPDLVIGNCDGTRVWINTPIPSVEFSHPQGLPELVDPDELTTVQVEIGVSNGTFEPGTPTLFASIDGGPFIPAALGQIGQTLFEGALPPAACGQRVQFYFSVEANSGVIFTDPADAPASTHGAIAADAVEIVFDDEIEGDVAANGWTIFNDPSLVTGAWEQAEPLGTSILGEPAAPSEDATPDGTMAFITQNSEFSNEGYGVHDVDEGPTRLLTPVLDLAEGDALVSYHRWMYHDGIGIPESLIVEVSNDLGASWTEVESVETTDAAWRPTNFVVGSFVEPTAQVQVRFSIADSPNDSVVEAGVDDVRVSMVICCPADLDGSGVVDVTDLLALLGLWGTDPGGPPDFDGDGNVGVTDLLLLLGAWGPCS